MWPLDLVRRTVETRHRVRGDVELTNYDDDGAYVALRFRINTAETNLGRAYDVIRKIAAEVQQAAEQAADEVGQRIAEVAARLSGWGSTPLDVLVDPVETAKSPDDKRREGALILAECKNWTGKCGKNESYFKRQESLDLALYK